jgi:hypothetical protein
MFSFSVESVQMIFVDKNNLVFVPNFCILSFYVKHTSGELIKIFGLS